MVSFLIQMAFIIFVSYTVLLVFTKHKTGKSVKEISSIRWRALKRLFDTDTKIFLLSAFVFAGGVVLLTRMMEGNLRGILYSWKMQSIVYALMLQMLPVMIWYLVRASKEPQKDKLK